ncbi:hypothetical protein CEX93_20140, partial [Xanthomonas euvesicatoria]
PSPDPSRRRLMQLLALPSGNRGTAASNCIRRRREGSGEGDIETPGKGDDRRWQWRIAKPVTLGRWYDTCLTAGSPVGLGSNVSWQASAARFP